MLTASIVLLVLIAILAVPVVLTYRISWRLSFEGRIQLQWLFGLVRISLPRIQTGSGSEGIEKAAKKPQRRRRPARRKSNPVAAFRQKRFRQRALRFVREIWNAIQKRDLSLRLRIGLGDPADTGQLWAIVGPLSGILADYRQADIDIEPEFADAVFELDSSGNIRVLPLQIVYLVLGLLLSPAIWRGLKQMRAAG